MTENSPATQVSYQDFQMFLLDNDESSVYSKVGLSKGGGPNQLVLVENEKGKILV